MKSLSTVTLLLILLSSGCEDKRLKRAKLEAEVWKSEAAKWEQTAKDWEIQANRAVAAAYRAQTIADKCLEEKKQAENKK